MENTRYLDLDVLREEHLKDYTDAIAAYVRFSDLSAERVRGEIRSWVADLLDGKEVVGAAPVAGEVIEYVRKRLSDQAFPINWLTDHHLNRALATAYESKLLSKFFIVKGGLRGVFFIK